VVTVRAALPIAPAAAVTALTLAGLALVPRAAEAQRAMSGTIGVAAYVMPFVRPDTIAAARAPQWRSTVPATEPVLVRGAMVRDTVVADDRRRLVLAYVGV
jgi:hypothetical protein